MKIIENRLVEFLTGCGVLYAAYDKSPQTTTEIFIAIGGCALEVCYYSCRGCAIRNRQR